MTHQGLCISNDSLESLGRKYKRIQLTLKKRKENDKTMPSSPVDCRTGSPQILDSTLMSSSPSVDQQHVPRSSSERQHTNISSFISPKEVSGRNIKHQNMHEPKESKEDHDKRNLYSPNNLGFNNASGFDIFDNVSLESSSDFESPNIIVKNRRSIKYNETTRKKNARKSLHGKSCPCCTGYYDCTAKLSNLPERIEEISRHRFQHVPPSTPPGFWDIGFTQLGP